MEQTLNRMNTDLCYLDTAHTPPPLPKISDFDDVEEQIRNWKGEELSVNLKQNQPNPFSYLTEIQYFLSKPGHALLTLHDITGKEVARLIYRNVPASWSSIIVNGSGLSNGVYFLKLESEGKMVTKTINKAN